MQETACWPSLMERFDGRGRQGVVAVGTWRQRHRDDPGRSRRVQSVGLVGEAITESGKRLLMLSEKSDGS